jgi:hypothetical protein
VLGWATGNSDSQDSPRPILGASHHLPSYSILYASPQGPHPNGFFRLGTPKWESQNSHCWGSTTLGSITLCLNLQLQWVLKKSCSLCQELSNSMPHATWTRGNHVNSWFFVVRSQIANLTPGLSFGHNLCFRCPNGQCEPLLGIYISIYFQWYKKIFKPMGFHTCNYALKVSESIWDTNSQHGSSLVSVRVHSLTLFALPGTCDVTLESLFWPTTLQPPCLGRKPKARVTIVVVFLHLVMCHTSK